MDWETVWVENGPGTWNYRFGRRVQLSANGEKIVVQQEGSELMFAMEDPSTGNWNEYADDGLSGDQPNFGSDRDPDVMLSGNGERLLVARKKNSYSIAGDWVDQAGRVSVHRYDSAGDDWPMLGSSLYVSEATTEGDPRDYSHFGWGAAISYDGNRIAVGAPGVETPNGGVARRGRVLAFDYDASSDSWNRVGGMDDMTGLEDGDSAGEAVAISDDGSRIAYGAPYWEGSSERV